ncbi:aminodeoxychorismate lyase [Halorhodospira abdelmalekii]|nr:aminodeoxychorismate lyase [Halorhodospira abdelmalekii]
MTLVFVSAVAVLVLAVPVVGYLWVGQRLDAPLQMAPEEQRIVQIEPGSSFRGVVNRLAAAGWIDEQTVWALRLYARAGGELTRLQAGEYAVEESLRVRDLLDRMQRGEVVNHRLTVIEGWTVADLIGALRRHDAIRFTLEGVAESDLLAAIGIETPDYLHSERHPEGLFYPTTYRFPRGTSDRQLLRQAYTEMQRRLAAVWAQRQSGLPLDSPYEALILASIVEREAALAEERPRIAGVFIRRLEKGMRLQADPTVVYGLGDEFEGRLRRADLRRDTPYNTYTRHGLPVTPIALPGSASLQAAVDPAPGDELYFVARGDGSHHFSKTLEEHNRAVQRYILGRQ